MARGIVLGQVGLVGRVGLARRQVDNFTYRRARLGGRLTDALENGAAGTGNGPDDRGDRHAVTGEYPSQASRRCR